MMPPLEPGEIGVLGAQAIGELTARAVSGAQIADYVERDPMPWSVLGDGGWDLLGAPESDGGGGAGVTDLVVVARAWGRSCVPLPYLSTLMAKRWSPAAREHPGPVGLSVADGDPASGGQVPFGGTEGLRLLRSVDGPLEDAPGGDHDPWVPSLRPVPSPWVSDLGAEEGTELAVVWAAEATGIADRLLELSVSHAVERQQFGRPLGSFQAVKHRLASMAVTSEAAETAVLWAAAEPNGAAAPARWAVDECVTLAESAVQVHGGMGFTWELGLHHYLRHLLVLRDLVGGVTR